MRNPFVSGCLTLLAALCAAAPAFADDVLCIDNLLDDGGFEGGLSGGWTDAQINGYAAIYNTGAARSGVWCLWFGGTGSALPWNVTQAQFFPAGGALTLSFYLRLESPNPGDFLEAGIDSDVLATYTNTTPGFSQYKQVIFDVSAYADGQQHTVFFRGTVSGDIFVDDVCLSTDTSNTCALALPIDTAPYGVSLQNTPPARDAFASEGVRIRTGGVNDGPALLRASDWPVLGTTAPAVLVMTNFGTNLQGGSAAGPATFYCDAPVDGVVLRLGTSDPGPGSSATVTAFAENGDGRGNATVPLPTSTLETLALDAAGIASFTVSYTGDNLVIDDVCLGSDPRRNYCSGDELFSQALQSVADPYTVFTADASFGLPRYEFFENLIGSFQALRWWGIFTTPGANEACSPADAPFLVELFADNAGAPGAIQFSQLLEPEATPTGRVVDAFSDSFTEYQFDLVFDLPVAQTKGWLRLSRQSSPACVFNWTSGEGDGLSGFAVSQGGAFQSVTTDLAFCIAGGPGAPLQSCSEDAAYAQRLK